MFPASHPQWSMEHAIATGKTAPIHLPSERSHMCHRHRRCHSIQGFIFFGFLKNIPLVATYKDCTTHIRRVSSHHGSLQCGLPMQTHRRFCATILHRNGGDDHIRRNVHHHLGYLGSLRWHVGKREMLLLRGLSDIARGRHHNSKETQCWILPHDAGRASIKHGQETSSNRRVR